jgi:CxxC motif-containing protein (DUF1111 family)
MGDPLPGLTPSELARFESGKFQFDRNITIAEGLGPIFNQSGCSSCHSGGGAGGAGNTTVTRFGAAEKGGFDPLENLGGSLLQAQAIDDMCLEVVPPEAGIVRTRTTPSVFGAGLVQAIDEADILFYRDNPPGSVSGFAHMVHALEDSMGAPDRVGRFGWKAQVATMLTFAADAGLNEMGLTNRLVMQENAPNGNLALLADCDDVPDPEDSIAFGGGVEFIDQVDDFQRFLAPPPQTPKSGMLGEAIFVSIGCADCHVPSFTTGTAPETALSNKDVKPYSDFLLHNMGLLGDGIVQGAATEQEMITRSLWGVRIRDPLLHDASIKGGTFASRVTLAIQAHDDGINQSEGRFAAQLFAALSQSDKDLLIAFLDSLGRAEFDHDGDDFVEGTDFGAFYNCLNGPDLNTYMPDHVCAISDIDQNGAVDLVDFGFLQQAAAQ